MALAGDLLSNSAYYTLAGIGVEVTFVDATDCAQVEKAVTDLQAKEGVLVSDAASGVGEFTTSTYIGWLYEGDLITSGRATAGAAPVPSSASAIAMTAVSMPPQGPPWRRLPPAGDCRPHRRHAGP